MFQFRMFSEAELLFLQKIVKNVDINEMFSSEELAAFSSNKSNICENLFVPKHRRKVQIIRLKKLFTSDFNLFETTEEILSCLKNETELRIGISLLVQAGPQSELIRYYYSIFHRPLNPTTYIATSLDREKLLNFLKPLSNSDILNLAFSQINAESVFEKSDFRPRKLVIATFWLARSND